MPDSLSLGTVHHLRLTVTDVERSRAFYTEVLGFAVAVDAPPPAENPFHSMVDSALQGGVILITNGMLLGLRPCRGVHASQGDRFDEHRVGLDHLSFNVGSKADLEQAVRILDERGVPHGEITDLPPFGIAILEFRDPDNIQLELTAPLES